MRRRFIVLAAIATAVWPFAGRAQVFDRVRRLGMLMPFDPRDAFGQQIIEALYQGLQQHGWVEADEQNGAIRGGVGGAKGRD